MNRTGVLLIRKWFVPVLIMALLLAYAQGLVFSVEDDSSVASAGQEVKAAVTENKYLYYNETYAKTKTTSEIIVIDPLKFSSSEGVTQTDASGRKSISTSETGFVTYTFNAPQTARYVLTVEYLPLAGKNTKIERELKIDGEYPFTEARNIEFVRTFEEVKDAVKKDENGNEYFNGVTEVFQWTRYSVSDNYGYYNEPFSFYLTKGEHTLTLNSIKEPMAISLIEFGPERTMPAYSDYLADAKEKGAVQLKGESLVIEAEKSRYISDTVLYPGFDRSSPDTTPVSAFNVRLNMISGTQWQQAGQWILWDTDVAKDGLYKISFRVRQNYNDGLFTTRKLYIDGEIPFKQAENVTFKYDSTWQIVNAGGSEPFYFYLTKGRHTLKLQNTLGSMAEILVVVDEILRNLNNDYIDIMTITGPVPDRLRDYKLEKLIPDTVKDLKIQSDLLYKILEKVKSISGIKGSYLSSIERIALECRQMSNEPAKIPKLFDTFKNDLGSLALWLTNSQLQPLDIDKIYVSSSDLEISAANSNIFQVFRHKIVVFLSSFFNDINSFKLSKDKDSIKVWLGSGISTGRDQAMIMKKMIEDTFTPEEKVAVDFQLVAPGSLLPASLSGRGPDIALRIGATDSMNFALRGAVLDISKFSDFKNVTTQFHESALVPLSYSGKSYALPETQSFPVMFYRKDILQTLGINPPETWDDVYDILPVLQRNNMDFVIPVTNFSSNEAFGISGNQTNGLKSYAMLLFQRNAELYREDGKYSALDGKIQTEVFKQWTSLFRDYKLPIAYEFANRFALGEIPVGIADYTVYNSLMVYFPEIKGLWAFKEVPGTKQADGTINHAVPGDVSGAIIMKNTKNEDASWKFLKFWTNTKSQVRFGQEMESMLGPSARWPSANVDAVKQTAWNTQDLKTLISQYQYVKGVPEVPGGYYTTRYLDMAFRRVVYYRDNAKDTLLSNVRIINEELLTKRREFGFDK